MRRLLLLAAASSLLAGSALADPLVWTSHGSVAEGSQFDAVRGPDDRVHLASSRYYQLDVDGTVLVDEGMADGHQGALDFPPAIAASLDGAVHLVTRHDGGFEEGNDIRYRRRSPAGSWDRDYLVGSRERRNYVVGAAKVGTRVVVAYTVAGSDVWGDVRLWEAGETSAMPLGDVGGIWRADTGLRLRSNGTRLFLASGKPDPGGAAYLLHATAEGDVAVTLASNTWTHQPGGGRRGFVDLQTDALGHAHLTYGSQHQAWYSRYDDAGQPVHTDVPIGSDLGDWHMSVGLSAVAASDDGQSVVAVMLQADGSQQASNSDLLWTYSLDGGATWAPQADLGVNTHGGEGRQLPRLVAIGDSFLLLYVDTAAGGISLMTMYVEHDEDGDGWTADQDCDDGDPAVHPDADEICDDGIDNDCDGLRDEDDPDCPDPVDDDDLADDDDSAVWPDDDDSAAWPDDDDAADDDDDSALPGIVQDCGCSSGAGGAATPVSALLVLAAGLLRRRGSCGSIRPRRASGSETSPCAGRSWSSPTDRAPSS